MSVQLQVSQVFDRPIAAVFNFLARDHVRNHPRWDLDMQLEQVTEGPVGVGTLIRRINSHSGIPVEGTMEVVEFEPNRVFATLIHDGPVETRSRATFDALGDDRTKMTIHVQFPGMDESVDKELLTSRIERSTQNMKRLVESET